MEKILHLLKQLSQALPEVRSDPLLLLVIAAGFGLLLKIENSKNIQKKSNYGR